MEPITCPSNEALAFGYWTLIIIHMMCSYAGPPNQAAFRNSGPDAVKTPNHLDRATDFDIYLDLSFVDTTDALLTWPWFGTETFPGSTRRFARLAPVIFLGRIFHAAEGPIPLY